MMERVEKSRYPFCDTNYQDVYHIFKLDSIMPLVDYILVF